MFFLSAKSQDAKNDFKKINVVYNTTPAFSMDIKYELFLDGSKKANEEEVGKYLKNNSKYYTLQGNSEIIITDKYMFIVDKTSKIFAADYKIDENKISNPLSLSLDSLFVLYSKIETIIQNSNGIKGYRFFIKEGPYSICEVYFNVKTNFVTEIKNVFREKILDENNIKRTAVLKTTFYNMKFTINKDLFENSRYIKKVKDKFVLTDNYKTYKFINHLK